jgi:hypothetical protein
MALKKELENNRQSYNVPKVHKVIYKAEEAVPDNESHLVSRMTERGRTRLNDTQNQDP